MSSKEEPVVALFTIANDESSLTYVQARAMTLCQLYLHSLILLHHSSS